MAHVTLTQREYEFIQQCCIDETGFFDDTDADGNQSVHGGFITSLANKGILQLYEHRSTADGGDLFVVAPKYEHLFNNFSQ